MSTEKQNEKSENQEDNSTFDMVDLWKKFYFENEEASGKAVKEFLASSTFNEIMNNVRGQYLASYRLGHDSLEKVFEVNSIPSKKDLAGIKELIIALEDKIDQIDFQIYNNLARITDSVLKMAEHQNLIKEELVTQEQKVDILTAALISSDFEPAGEAPDPEKTTIKKKSRSKAVKESAD